MEVTKIVLTQTAVPNGKWRLKYVIPRQTKPPITKYTNYMNFCPTANLLQAEIKKAYWDPIKVGVNVNRTQTNNNTVCTYYMKATKAIPNWIVSM